jgi:hypothetical protein
MRFLWPGLIEVLNIGMKDTVQLLLVKDEQVIETLATPTAHKPFTDRIGAFRVIRCFQDLDAAGCGHASETGSKLVITITDEILRTLSKCRGFPKLLCGPSVRGRSRDADVNHSARVQFDNEEGEQRAEEEIGDREKAAGPDLLGMSM